MARLLIKFEILSIFYIVLRSLLTHLYFQITQKTQQRTQISVWKSVCLNNIYLVLKTGLIDFDSNSDSSDVQLDVEALQVGYFEQTRGGITPNLWPNYLVSRLNAFSLI